MRINDFLAYWHTLTCEMHGDSIWMSRASYVNYTDCEGNVFRIRYNDKMSECFDFFFLIENDCLFSRKLYT